MTSAVTVRKLSWLLKQNGRYAPLLDTVLKLLSLLVPAGIIVGLSSRVTFNAYLGQIGQAPLPTGQADDLLFLFIIGAYVSLIFAVIILAPAAWTTIVRSYAPDDITTDTIRKACGVSAGTVLLFGIVTFWFGGNPTPYGVLAALALGGLTGGLVITHTRMSFRLLAAAFLGFAISSFAISYWLTCLLLLLMPVAEPLATGWPLASAIGLVALLGLQIALCIAKPALGIVAGLAITLGWIMLQVSPDGGRMLPAALYVTNLGGGRPAHIDQEQVDGEICNLGVDARPVLVFEQGGCERRAAFRRLNELSGLNSLARKHVLAEWKAEVQSKLHLSHRG